MFSRTAVALVVATAAFAQDAAKTLDVAKRESLREGPLAYRVSEIFTRRGTDYFSVAVEVKNVSEKENVERAVWWKRLEGHRLVDDRGREYKGVKNASTPQKILAPGQTFTRTLSLAGKPNPKAQTLLLTLPKNGDAPEVIFRIPFKLMVTK